MRAFTLLLIAVACGGVAFGIRTVQRRRAGVEQVVANGQARMTAAWAASGAVVGALMHRWLNGRRFRHTHTDYQCSSRVNVSYWVSPALFHSWRPRGALRHPHPPRSGDFRCSIHSHPAVSARSRWRINLCVGRGSHAW